MLHEDALIAYEVMNSSGESSSWNFNSGEL